MATAIEVVAPTTRRIDRLVRPSVYPETGILTYQRLELHPGAGAGWRVFRY